MGHSLKETKFSSQLFFCLCAKSARARHMYKYAGLCLYFSYLTLFLGPMITEHQAKKEKKPENIVDVLRELAGMPVVRHDAHW